MLKLISAVLKSAPEDFWIQKIKNVFDISCHAKEPGTPLDPIILRQTYQILSQITPALVKATGVKNLCFSTAMGKSLTLYPNHGYFYPADRSITLNSDIFYHPDIQEDFFSPKGYFIGRPAQTLTHELGHAFDDIKDQISEKPEWLQLSGWSPTPQPGLKRLIINDPQAPSPVIGEWFFDPEKKFTRFYAKRNPADDFADSFSFYVGGLKDKVPSNKRVYLDTLLKSYLFN